MMHLLSESHRRDPYPLYERLRRDAPLLHDAVTGFWMVFDHAGVKRVLQDHEAFGSAVSPDGGKPLEWLVFMDPPRHTKLRALVSRAFTPASIARLEGRVRAISRELLDAVVDRGAADLAVEYAIPLPARVIAEMIGVPWEDRTAFERWNAAMTGLSDTVAGTPEAAAHAAATFQAATDETRAYLAAHIAQRRAAPRDDLLTRLVEADVDGERLSDDEIVRFFQILLVAGTETATSLIGNAVLALLDHPDQRARLDADPGLLPAAIEEVLRWRSPAQTMFRGTRRDVELHGQVIPAGRLVLPMIGSANRDERAFRDAATFDVTRDPNPHVAFGHGIHFCLGAPLARLEARVALSDLLARLPGLALAGTWTPRRAFHLLGPARLPVTFAPR